MKKAVIYIAAAALLVAAAFTPVFKRICVTDYADSGLLTAFNGNDFVVSYTHSVNRGRVRDYYRVIGDTVYLTHTVFTSYGAGMPEPDGTETFNVTDEGLEVSGIDLELKELILQTGVIAGHELEADGKTVVFNEIIPPQTRIVIDIRRISLYDMLRVCIRG